MNMDELKGIFIEEATEIIEKLDIDIINFEEDPSDKELLNELFRGVHTLKGSANSFGFSNLGGFVHHFEDVLDYYRSSDEEVTASSIDLFLEAVDIIKEVMWKEVDGINETPSNYNKCLDGIKEILNRSDTTVSTNEKTQKEETSVDFAEEFGDISIENSEVEESSLLSQLHDGEELYHITLTLDDDIYFRGFDHAKLMKLLSGEGRILESHWDMEAIPTLDTLDCERSYFKEVIIYFASLENYTEIEEIFEYIEKNEYSIKKISRAPAPVEPISIVETEIKYGNRSSDETQEKPKEKKQFKRRKSDSVSFVKVDTSKLDELFDSVGELVIAQNFLAESEDIQGIQDEYVQKSLTVLEKITKLIQNRVMSLRMVPIHDTFEKMKRVARDASKKVNKEISLNIEGAETEIDKLMVDALSDPLIHVMRNAIDHGMEDSQEERTNQGKTAIGQVTLSAYHKGGNIAIEVRDDGRGINRDKVFDKAVAQGIIKSDDTLTDTEVFALIMKAGFSTADVISDISGRGVGLDVVRSSIEKLQGKVEISSEVGKGSTFTILLPLTLAIIDGMIVETCGDTYIIPTLSVIESFAPSKDIVHRYSNRGEFVDLRGEMIPIIRLNKILDLSDDMPEPWESTLMCIENERGKYALLVDDLIGRQQVVIKTLGPALSKILELSGSAIMGTGEIALILNMEELYSSKKDI
jgi:two-component system, chemotaxis family, sensor kinase CheA